MARKERTNRCRLCNELIEPPDRESNWRGKPAHEKCILDIVESFREDFENRYGRIHNISYAKIEINGIDYIRGETNGSRI